VGSVQHLKLDDEQRAIIGKYAAQHGIIKAIHHFAKDFKDDLLKESTVRGCIRLCWKYEEGGQGYELPSKKMGHPLMLGNTIDKQVQTYLIEPRSIGGIVNRQPVPGGLLGGKTAECWQRMVVVMCLQKIGPTICLST